MISTINDFNERKNEVVLYIKELKKLEKLWSVDINFIHIAKSTIYLLLYNLIESSVVSWLEEINTHFQNQGVEYNQMKESLQKHILSNLKNCKINLEDSYKIIWSNINNNVFLLKWELNKDKSHKRYNPISGSADAKKIREIAEKYSFSSKTDWRKTKKWVDLLMIKERRNRLAHWETSFKTLWQGERIIDLEKSSKRTLKYIEWILNNMDKYLKKSEYLRA